MLFQHCFYGTSPCHPRSFPVHHSSSHLSSVATGKPKQKHPRPSSTATLRWRANSGAAQQWNNRQRSTKAHLSTHQIWHNDLKCLKSVLLSYHIMLIRTKSITCTHQKISKYREDWRRTLSGCARARSPRFFFFSLVGSQANGIQSWTCWRMVSQSAMKSLWSPDPWQNGRV